METQICSGSQLSGCQYTVGKKKRDRHCVMSSPFFQSDNSWNVTWHTLLEYYPTASLWAIGWVLTFSFHGLVHERECASCHTGGNPKINVASGSQPSSPLHWKWDLFPTQLYLWPILDGLTDRMYPDRCSTHLPVIRHHPIAEKSIYAKLTQNFWGKKKDFRCDRVFIGDWNSWWSLLCHGVRHLRNI